MTTYQIINIAINLVSLAVTAGLLYGRLVKVETHIQHIMKRIAELKEKK